MLNKKILLICCAYISIFHSDVISDKPLKCIELDTSSPSSFIHYLVSIFRCILHCFPFFHHHHYSSSQHIHTYNCLLWPLISLPRQRFQFKHTHFDFLLGISHVDFIKKEGKTISILLYSILLGQSVTSIFTGEVPNTIFDDVPFHVI